jgi:hypothetical protein
MITVATISVDVGESPFNAGTGLLDATESNQSVTKENAHWLPPGSVVRFADSEAVLIHLHDNLWYWRDGCSWCYDRLDRFYPRLPGVLCHHP